MSKLRSNAVIFMLCVLSVCPLAIAGTVAISIAPSSQVVPFGSIATFDLRVSGLGDHTAPSLGTFDLALSFDGAILGFNSFLFGDPSLGDELDLFGLGSITSISPAVGSVEIFELSLDSISDLNDLQAPNFILGSFSFSTLAIGSSSLTLIKNALGDASGGALDAILNGGNVDVAANEGVPEPGTILMLISGVSVLGLRYRQANRKASQH